MESQVLNIGKALLEDADYKRFCEEYHKVEKYICRLKIDTQVQILLTFLNEV